MCSTEALRHVQWCSESGRLHQNVLRIHPRLSISKIHPKLVPDSSTRHHNSPHPGPRADFPWLGGRTEGQSHRRSTPASSQASCSRHALCARDAPRSCAPRLASPLPIWHSPQSPTRRTVASLREPRNLLRRSGGRHAIEMGGSSPRPPAPRPGPNQTSRPLTCLIRLSMPTTQDGQPKRPQLFPVMTAPERKQCPKSI